MHILLMYPGGRQRDGLLLAGTRERMRVMMPGQADVVEFRQIEGAWVGESGATVEIGAIGTAAAQPMCEVRSLAGQSASYGRGSDQSHVGKAVVRH